MSLVHFAARSMLASFFIVQGTRALRDPEPLVEEAEPVARGLVEGAHKYLPAEWASRIPEDPKQLVRLNGLLQVVGGIGLATGFGRRSSAALLGITMLPHLLAGSSTSNASEHQANAAKAIRLRNVALLGGVTLAALDTEGRPGLRWRAKEATRVAAGVTDRQLAKAAKARRSAAKRASLASREAKLALRQAQHRLASAMH